MENDNDHIVSDGFSPLIRESIRTVPGNFNNSWSSRFPPLAHKTLYNFANKKVSTIQPPLSRGEVWINIGSLAIGSCRANRGISPQRGSNSADSAPRATRCYWPSFCQRGWYALTGWNVNRNGRSWSRYAEFPIFPTPRHVFALNEPRLRKLRWLPLVFFRFFILQVEIYIFLQEGKIVKWLSISFQLCNRKIFVIERYFNLLRDFFFFNRDWKMYGFDVRISRMEN